MVTWAAGEPKWDHVLPHIPAQLRQSGHRLDHDYIEYKPPYDPRHGPARIPPPAPAGLHGGRQSYHLTAVMELSPIGPSDGGFGCLAGSHHPEYELPTHTGWQLPPWDPQLVPIRRVAEYDGGIAAGDCIVFAEKVSHTTIPWTGKGERRTVFFKFVPYGMHHGDHQYFPPETDNFCSLEQRQVLSLPEWWYNAPGRQPCQPYRLPAGENSRTYVPPATVARL